MRQPHSSGEIIFKFNLIPDRDAIPIREDPEKMIGGLSKLLTAVPNDARYYDVIIDQMGNLDPGDLEQAVESATMIEISIDNYSI